MLNKHPIKDILSGVYDAETKALLETLKTTQSTEQAQVLLEKMINQQRLIGLSDLLDIMIQNPNKEVRKAILQHIKKLGLIKGVGYEPDANIQPESIKGH